MYDEHTLTYLQLFLLREPSNPFPGGRLTHEGHDPDQRLVAVQHLCDLLHALAEGREDHDACADLSRRLRLCTNHSRVQTQEFNSTDETHNSTEIPQFSYEFT